MIEKLITDLIAALEANTAAHLGKAKSKKAEATPATATETATTAAPAEKPPVATPVSDGTSRVELTALAQSILDAAAAKNMTGAQSGASRIKVVNTKHGFKSSTCEGQPVDKLLAFKTDLEQVLQEIVTTGA